MTKLILGLSLCGLLPVWGQTADFKKLDFLIGKWSEWPARTIRPLGQGREPFRSTRS